ncbi:MAG TPA: acyl-CoA dehydrogenase family protein, partial [Chloroflexota bacterium]|nr:acyl-CoA dehydrogenase family protein [Chloroflexota bacterium]
MLDRVVALQPTVRSYQEQTERELRIPPPLVERLAEAGLYRLVVPRQLGGLEVDVLTYLRAAELMAEADGSVGWNIGNNAIGQFIALGLPEEGVGEIFENGPDTIIAGTAVPGGGTAVRVDGGYLVSGHWSFGSGCREAQWMMANFELEGTLYRSFVRPQEVKIIDTWDMTGMRGTGSHDWTVSEVFVPERRTV